VVLRVINFKAGKTESKKEILCFMELNLSMLDDFLKIINEYSLDDLLDAYCVFEYLIKRSLKRSHTLSPELLMYMDNQKMIKRRFASEAQFEEVKIRNGIRTSIDACNHGSKLVSPEFKDL